VLASGEDRTRVELEPVTGRSHQLRVHLLAIGHPILGDALYAPAPVRERAPRLLLHATSLRLAHPASGEPLAFHSSAPF
jgi:tRNA pseudouridine32 synthase / 23S rRNA pseudouridine746 synthase